MAAKKSSLETLHEMLTELFMEDIKICRSEGIPMSASDKAVIVKFLKDNDVTAAPVVQVECCMLMSNNHSPSLEGLYFPLLSVNWILLLIR